jgi:hypothetical protein
VLLRWLGTQGKFNLQHNTVESSPSSVRMERLERENAILHHGTCESSEKDLELQVTNCRHSKAKHELNCAQQQLDLAREGVDTGTHTIMHLKNAIET